VSVCECVCVCECECEREREGASKEDGGAFMCPAQDD